MVEFFTATAYYFTLFLSSILVFIFFVSSSSSSRSRNTTPCPSSYPLIGNLITFLRNRHRFHDWVAEMLSETLSSTLKVRGFLGTSRGICTANPVNVEHLLRSNFSNFIKGSRFHDVLFKFLGDGIFNVDGDLWTSQRKIANHEFNTKSLKSFVADTVQFEISDRLLPFLSDACDQRDIIDLQEILKRFAFDNICNLVFGDDSDCLRLYSSVSSPSSRFVQAFDDAIEISGSRYMAPVPLIWKIKRFLARHISTIERKNNHLLLVAIVANLASTH